MADQGSDKKRDELAAAEVRAQLTRLLQGSCLRAAPRQQRLLSHIVEATLAGDADRLKGYTLGVEVFDRGVAFDPNIDPIVRVEMGRLRSKLLAYYSEEGAGDPLLVEVPKGGNAARFSLRRSADRDTDRATAGFEPPRPERPRLAVLPFRSLSTDAQHELLADTLTEDLVTELSKLSGLFVVSRHAAFAHKGSTTAVPVIAAELGVRYVVEGTVRGASEALRITARLVDTQKSEALWAERYDHALPLLFEVQDDVTQQIVRALALRLSPIEEARLGQAATTSAEARSLVQRGIGLYWTYTEQGLRDAEHAFTESVRLDADYAAAHAWLALAAVVRYSLALDRTDASLQLARSHVRTALAIDPLLPWAHVVACHVEHFGLQPQTAIAAGRRAIALDPNHADAHAVLALALVGGNRLSEALAEIELALQLNPRPTGYIFAIKGGVLSVSGRLEEAIATYRAGLQAHPHFRWTAVWLASCLMQAGREAEARRLIEGFRAGTADGELVCRVTLADPDMHRKRAEALRLLGFRVLGA